MASKRRGILTAVAGIGILALRGADEAVRPIARGVDELLAAGRKGGDDTAKTGDEGGSLLDDTSEAVDRYYRRERMRSLLEDESKSDSFSLPPGSYAGYRIAPSYRSGLSYEFETALGRSVDVLLFDAEGFDGYEYNGETEFDMYGSVLMEDRAEQTADIDPTDNPYYLIFDNTDAGLSDETEGDVTITTTVSLSVL